MNNEQSSSTNRSLMIGVVVVLVIGAIGFWLFNMQNKSLQQSTTPPAAENQTEETTEDSDAATNSAMEGEVKEFTVESKGLNFTPSEIKVKKGDKVKITYKNTLGQHKFTLDEFNVKTKLLGAGEEETVEFTADQTGEFEYYCSVPGHRQAGMKGMLIVE